MSFGSIFKENESSSIKKVGVGSSGIEQLIYEYLYANCRRHRCLEGIEPNPTEISIPADNIDAIVVNPRNEQTGGVLQRQYFPMFTGSATTDIISAYNVVKLANTFTGIKSIRDSIDNAIARMAASLFVRETKPGSLVNIRIRLPDEVSRILFESGLYTGLSPQAIA
ncbi:MAG: hypothetical protein GY847_23935 [Proteobacteria bacterium]|nr:hypothetical protein [Pseudomonadota bacterium]